LRFLLYVMYRTLGFAHTRLQIASKSARQYAAGATNPSGMSRSSTHSAESFMGLTLELSGGRRNS